MAIRNNKDFLKEYKDDAWKGFSTRELLCIIGAAAIGITVDALLHFYAGVSRRNRLYFVQICYRHITVIIQPSYFYISNCRFFACCGEFLY